MAPDWEGFPLRKDYPLRGYKDEYNPFGEGEGRGFVTAEPENIIDTKKITPAPGAFNIPSAHGLLHLVIEMQGEEVIKVEPDIGYLHRGTEKLAENLLYHQFVPYMDRLDYLCAMSNNLAYVMAVEKLLDIEMPERVKYIRVVAAELSRIAGTSSVCGSLGHGIWVPCPSLLYAMREREIILDIFEMLCGARLTLSYMRVGGVRHDFTDECKEACLNLIKIMPERIDEYEKVLTGNRVWLKRNKDVGVISPEDAHRDRFKWSGTQGQRRKLGYPQA